MENLGWGLQMSVLGMGLVFALLALLWALLSLALRFDRTPVAQAAPLAFVRGDEAVGAGMPATPTVKGMDTDLVAAITVAVLTHKAVRRRQAAPEMRSYWPGALLYASRWVAIGRGSQHRNWRRRR